ncbi:MAG: phosphatase PAP2 family protein [Gemmatimonadota bacterium]
MKLRGTGLLPADVLFLAYMGATAALALFSGGTWGPGLALGHGLAMGGIFFLRGRPHPRGRLTAFLRVAYPVVLIPLLYLELARLNHVLNPGYFDADVQRWEELLFGVQLSMKASEWFPFTWLSELLHLGYFSYYLIVPTALIGTMITRGPAAVHRVALATALAFFVSYTVFLIFPVAGPRYSFPAIQGAISEGRFYSLVHAVLESGSSKGTAFPSSHIAASATAVLAAAREDRRWLWCLLPAELALAAGTVYGRFHYGVDALAGCVLAVTVLVSSPRVERRLAGMAAWLERGRSTAGSEPPAGGGEPHGRGTAAPAGQPEPGAGYPSR